MAKPQKPKDIDGYIAQFPADIQAILQKVRLTISSAAPEAKATISYLMPAFKLHGMLVYFAAWEKHIGLYPSHSRCDTTRPTQCGPAFARHAAGVHRGAPDSRPPWFSLGPRFFNKFGRSFPDNGNLLVEAGHEPHTKPEHPLPGVLP
jgi:hypothetical protein